MPKEKWIILLMKYSHNLKNGTHDLIMDIAETDNQGKLLVFDSLDEAHDHQEENGISGQCISLPLYD
jgi:hypothetical protein